MIHNLLNSIAATIVAVASGLSVAAGAVINFDDVAANTQIDTHYPGVTFGCVACASGHAFARPMNTFGSTTAASPPNVVSLWNSAVSGVSSFDARHGAVTAVFDTPQRLVSIDARPQLPLEFLGNTASKPFIEFYSTATQEPAALIAKVFYPFNFGDPEFCPTRASACGGTWQTLSYQSTTDNIKSVRFSSQQNTTTPAVYGDFDNLRFETTASLSRRASVSEYLADFNSPAPASPRFDRFGAARIEAGYLKLLSPGDLAGFGITYLGDFSNGELIHGFDATFDASLFGSTCCGGGAIPADGFSFNLVPAATVRSTPVYGEPGEEGLAEGLSVCFDTWDNGQGEAPAIDVKWLGQTIRSVRFQPSQSPLGINDPVAARRAVRIHLDTDGTIDVSYGANQVIVNLPTPYNPAHIGTPTWVMGARSGDANDNHWLDNLRITAYHGPQRCLDFNGPTTDLPLFGGARVADGYLKLLTVPTDSFGIAYIPDFGGGHLVQGFRASFKAALFGSTCCENGAFPADGFSFNLVPADSVRSAPDYAEPAEEGLPEGLSVNFDTWDNGGGEGPAIEIKWLDQVIARQSFQPSQSPVGAPNAAAAARDVLIDLRTDGTMDVSYGGTKVLNNVQTPYQANRIGVPVWVLGARVGAATDNHWIDDLCITTVATRARPIPGLFSTGVGQNRVALTEDQVDPHYVWLPNGLSISPSFPAYVTTSVGGFPVPPWVPDDPASAWISATMDTVMRGATGFVAQTRFDLTDMDAATARIVGRWAADNRGTAIYLNGALVAAPVAPSFDVWTDFSIGTGFVAGTNTLQFVIFNEPDLSQPNFQNPAGLRVELRGSVEANCVTIPASPLLQYQKNGAIVELRWRGQGWLLQSAQVINGPWFTHGGGQAASNGDRFASFPITSGARFFRLRRDCP